MVLSNAVEKHILAVYPELKKIGGAVALFFVIGLRQASPPERAPPYQSRMIAKPSPAT